MHIKTQITKLVKVMTPSESNGIRAYIKKINLELSDFLLIFGFIFSIPFYAFAWKFMVTWDPSKIFFDARMIVVCFAITVLCWAGYFVLEIKKGRLKFNLFMCVYIVMAIMSVVTVLVQKSINTFYVECKTAGYITQNYYPGTQVGDIVEVVVSITPTHKLFFACASFLITTIFYIVLFVLSKRITNMNFLVIIGIIVIVFMFGMCIYSYIVESNKYNPFIKAFLEGDGSSLKLYSMNSFVVMSVPYGVCMMLAFIFSLLIHTISKKSYWYLPAAFFLINMLFSYCRTSIAISYTLMVLYLTYRLIITFKHHKTRNTLFICFLYVAIFSLITLNIISFASKGDFVPVLYKHINSFIDKQTYETRKLIWNNIKNELSNGWFIIGRGFGTHNYMLYPMNLVNGDNVAPSHSTYLAILGAGGIINLIGFSGLFVYYFIIFIKSLKFNKTEPIALSAGLLAFFAYSFTEGVNYLLVIFTFPLILFYHIKCRN